MPISKILAEHAVSELLQMGYKVDGDTLTPPEELSEFACKFFGVVPVAGRSDLVPGVMHCAKCKFQLNRVTVCVSDGNTYAGDSKTEPCPNGCGPLWPVTWEQEARSGWKALEEMHDRLQNATRAAAPAQEADGWMPIETAPDGERVLLGPRHAPVVGTVHQPEPWHEEQEPTATVVHYNGTTLVAGYRCSEWHRLPGAGRARQEGGS